MFQTLKTVATALALVGVSAAQAATVYVKPQSKTAAPGEVSVDIYAKLRDNETTLGGDVTVNFKDAYAFKDAVGAPAPLLTYSGSTLIDSPLEGVVNESKPLTPDTLNFTFGYSDFDFSGVTGEQDLKLATLTFNYLGGQSAAIGLEGIDWAGLDLDTSIPTTYVGGYINPAVVPVPPAAWLMLSGLGLVGGVIRKRSRTPG